MPDKAKLPADFKEFCGAYREAVYKMINEYLPVGEPREFVKMVHSYTERKGQYRRPGYAILWAMLYGGKGTDAILPAAVQQMSEDYFLMHDDWMDGNMMRRGIPTAHVLFGPEYAILAGDQLHTILYKMTCDEMLALGAERGKRYFDKVYDMMYATHLGQYFDLSLTKGIKDITKFSIDDYYRSIHAKSAYYSVYGPMQVGAILMGASEGKVSKIREYGTPAGLAFQIKDDILDCTSTEAVLGKSIGNDVREGVKTIILWHAVQNAPAGTLGRLKGIYAKPREAKSDGDVRFVLDAFNELGSIAFAEKEAERLSNEALSLFDSAERDIPESEVKGLARSSISSTAKRSR
jgi:geranylgeranyl pyrophosphate synthase